MISGEEINYHNVNININQWKLTNENMNKRVAQYRYVGLAEKDKRRGI